MNKQNLRKLIKLIKDKNNKFDWTNPGFCVGHYAGKVLDANGRNDEYVIARCLNISLEEARELYVGNSLNGNGLFRWFDVLGKGLDTKPIAIKYLTSLLK